MMNLNLTEAKKSRKKRTAKKGKKVLGGYLTITTGDPWLNDERFNTAMGTADINDAVDSIGDALAGDGDGASSDGGGEAMGESLLNSAAATQVAIEKLSEIDRGTRGFNAKAASDSKLADYKTLCIKWQMPNALKIVEAEINRRAGTLPTGLNFELSKCMVFQDGVQAKEVVELKNNLIQNNIDIIDYINRQPKILRPRVALESLIIAVCVNNSKTIADSKTYLVTEVGVDPNELKQYLIDKLVKDTTLTNAIVALDENINKSNGNTLMEAKREVKRYYIRPQNIYCANKEEILRALIKLGDANCSVYTLNNLEDNKDTHLLSSADIIYYYDDGILYDKNKVRVMDYDLSVRKEEQRKRFTGSDLNMDRPEVKAEYKDRLVDTEPDVEVEIKEDLNPFSLEFDAVNAFGEILTEGHIHTCCICGEEFTGYGNNPSPVAEEGKCCDSCNLHFVLPARIAQAADANDQQK